MSSILDSYRGQSVALPTLHHKGALFAPSFLSILGMKVVEVDVNTDLLGSFAGEVQRVGTQLETVRKKRYWELKHQALTSHSHQRDRLVPIRR